MKIGKDRLISFGALAISKLLPDGKSKELLRRNYYRRYNPLYNLDKKLSKLELLENDILFVELDNGLKFYGLKEEIPFFWMKYGDPRKLGKLKGYSLFSQFFSMLDKIIYRSTYEEYCQPERGDIVVDLGANVGVFSVKVAKIVGDEGRVIAIEPEPDNFALLLKNIRANELENVIPIQKGVWSKKDKLKLHLSKYPECHSFYGTNNPNRLMVVEVDTLDNILRELGIKGVDFIKMDIEGSEIEALKGMGETLRKEVKLAIAAYHSISGKPTYKTIIPQLNKSGFEVHHTKEGIIYARKTTLS